MGGLNSGRRRKHTNIDDCIELDLAWLHKQPFFKSGEIAPLAAKKWRITDFHKRREFAHHVLVRFTAESMIIGYQIENKDTHQGHTHKHKVSLTSTPCNYGGVRRWFSCPACHNRVRVLYINPRQADIADMKPLCRACLNLHYASQMSNYIERHKTYERHLLANYGLYWARWRYDHELETHYLKMTPELELLKTQSQYDQQMEMLRLLIRTNRFFLREHRRALDSLKSREDQEMYITHLLQEWGPGHLETLTRQLHKPERRELVQEKLATWRASGTKSNAPLDLAAMIAFKKSLEEELEYLKAA